ELENRVINIAWSPNNLKLAVASSDRSIYLFDENGVKRDRFSTKPVDPKFGKKSYIVKGIAFSPESTKIAVGQTDCIVYVYKIGEDWGDKKVICNKFRQSAAVTCLIWPVDGPIIIGLADGKVRAAMVKSQKAQTLYTSDAMTIALASNVRGSGFLSSHADGSIIRYYIAEDGNAEPSGRVCVHGVPPYALAWPQSHILAAGCDKRLTMYDPYGKPVKTFDFSRDSQEREITVACCSPSGQSVAVGSWDKVRIFDWSPRRSIWEETNVRDLPNFYTVTALSWRRDGSKLVIGGLCGSVEQFETILRRTVVRGSHEVAYVGPSQVVIRPLSDSSQRPIVIRSQTGLEIEDVRILGRRDNNVVARTVRTLLIGDIELGLISEIPWEDRSGGEKFFFEYPVVCLIFCSGELTIVEYGQNEALGSVRTEAVNPHVVSVRVNERPSAGGGDNKKLAYLLDPRTVRVIDLLSGATISMIVHDARIDWLELSEAGHRLLSRDKRGRLWLSDNEGDKVLLMTGVSFASWVTGSDVVVAQTGQTLAVWYNVDAPEAVTLTSIKGDVVDIVREDGRTSVMVEEHGIKVAHLLDEGLIEFGTALHDSDFGRVILFLENMGDGPQVETMWENVARNAMNERKLDIAARCYAAMGDVAYAKFLKETAEIGEKYAKETGNDPMANPECWARLAILNGDLKTAEAIYLEQNELDKALDMYQRYWCWEDALNLAQSRNWSGLSELRDRHLAWLLDTGQAARAASIVETTNPRRAVKLYLEARRPGRAARLVLVDNELLEDERIVEEVISGLKATDLTELAGELLEKTGVGSEAIKCYAQAGVFARALDLARKIDPTLVVELERDWGKHLSENGHYDAAINHFIEAGETVLALKAAINARQWRKALQIIQVIEDDDPEIRQQCEKLGEYFSSIGERSLAENLFIRAENAQRAVEIHIQSGDWMRAHQVAQEHMKSDEANQVLAKHAESLQQNGELHHAESLYVAIGDHDEAIAMYRKAGNRSDMVRLVSQHRPDLLQTTHQHLARELDAAGKPREAEEHFLGAGDWRGAVTAYRSANMWEDALRVAKKASGEKAAQQVALMWARTLAPELGARLLMRLGYLEPCLQLACEANLFDWALEIAKYGTVDQKKEVHYRYAMALEDEGRFVEAEKEFVQAGKAMEAVQMYIHTRDWESAEDVARSHSQEAVGQVLIARAAEAAEGQDYATAEALLLRAHKPEMIIEHYKTAGMWSEALRVCREYLPSQEAALRRELGQRSAGLDGANALEEARKWLDLGEVRPALDTLILNPQAPRSYLIRAADILLHQADPETAAEIGGDLGGRLFSVGEHALAAQFSVRHFASEDLDLVNPPGNHVFQSPSFSPTWSRNSIRIRDPSRVSLPHIDQFLRKLPPPCRSIYALGKGPSKVVPEPLATVVVAAQIFGWTVAQPSYCDSSRTSVRNPSSLSAAPYRRDLARSWNEHELARTTACPRGSVGNYVYLLSSDQRPACPLSSAQSFVYPLLYARSFVSPPLNARSSACRLSYDRNSSCPRGNSARVNAYHPARACRLVKIDSCCSTYDVHLLFLDFLVHLYDSHQRETCNTKNEPRLDPPIVLDGTPLAGIETTRTFVLNYSDAVGVVDTLIQHGATTEGGKWRTRVNAGQTAGSRAAAATAITWSLNERLRIADNVDKGCARRVSTIQYRNPPPTQETLGGGARQPVYIKHVSLQSKGRTLFGPFAKYPVDVIHPYEVSLRKLFEVFPRDFLHRPDSGDWKQAEFVIGDAPHCPTVIPRLPPAVGKLRTVLYQPFTTTFLIQPVSETSRYRYT
ncbi:hypothetical protein ALC62_10796, partial [Cyphomyrmex costatus]